MSKSNAARKFLMKQRVPFREGRLIRPHSQKCQTLFCRAASSLWRVASSPWRKGGKEYDPEKQCLFSPYCGDPWHAPRRFLSPSPWAAISHLIHNINSGRPFFLTRPASLDIVPLTTKPCRRPLPHGAAQQCTHRGEGVRRHSTRRQNCNGFSGRTRDSFPINRSAGNYRSAAACCHG